MASETFTGWRTPKRLFNKLDRSVDGFAVDAAADSTNHLVSTWYGEGGVSDNALLVPRWLSPAWCNPPYGKQLQPFMDKILEQVELGGTIVALLPAYTERKWWFEKVVPYADVLFLVGRVPFERPCGECSGLGRAEESECGACNATGIDSKKSQPRDPSAVCIFTPTATGRVGWLEWNT